MSRNVMVVLTDDHAQWANGCYGNREVETPTIDHLARTGVLMENAFCPTPVCSPARASFWTGRLPSQHGVHDYLGGTASPRHWLEEETNLAELFAAAGYLTGLAGKWHLGGGGLPARGFHYWAQHDLTRAMAEAFQLFNGGRPIDTSSSRGFSSPWGEAPPRFPDDGGHRIVDHAADFLHRRDDRPFFLYVGFIGTHSPWTANPERLVERYRRCSFDDIPTDTVGRFGVMSDESRLPSRRNPREALAQYYAAVSLLDEQLGRLLDELADQDVLDDTLVVYTSDHGLNLGQHGVWGKGNGTRPLNFYEESIRIPLVLSHAGADLMRGTRRSETVTHLDTFQTLLEWAGVAIPESVRTTSGLPGRSYLPMLHGSSVAGWSDDVYCEYGDARMVRTSRHKLIHRARTGRTELYDLVADPRERVDLAADAAHTPVVADLRSRIDAYFGRYDRPETSGLGVWDRPQPNAWPGWVDQAPF